MSKLPKWTESSDIKWRPVSEKPGNTGIILTIYPGGERGEVYSTPLDDLDWAAVQKYCVAWAWVCWDKT